MFNTEEAMKTKEAMVTEDQEDIDREAREDTMEERVTKLADMEVLMESLSTDNKLK